MRRDHFVSVYNESGDGYRQWITDQLLPGRLHGERLIDAGTSLLGVPFMKQPLLSLKKRVDNAIDSLLGLLVIAMVLVVGLQVFYRYVLNSPLPWPEEVARIMIVWLTFVGGYIALRENKHVGFEILFDKLSPRAKEITRVVSEALVAVFLAVVVVEGARFAMRFASTPMTYTRIPTGRFVYSVFPISGTLMLIQAALNLVESVTKVLRQRVVK